MRILLREQNRYKIKLEKEKLCRRRASQEEMEATKLQQQQSRLKRKMNQQQKSVSTTRHAEVENDHDGNEEDESNQVNCTSAQLINHPHAVKRLHTASPILTSASIPAASASTQHQSQPHPQSQPTHPVTAIVLHGPPSSSRSIPCPACSACLLCLVHDTGNTDATFQATAQLSHSIPTNHAGVSHVRSIQSESSLGAVTVRMMMIALEWIEFVRHFPFSSSPISGSA